MKKIIILFLMTIAITGTAFSEKRAVPTQVHNGGRQSQNLKEDRSPINLPLAVYYDSDTTVTIQEGTYGDILEYSDEFLITIMP